MIAEDRKTVGRDLAAGHVFGIAGFGDVPPLKRHAGERKERLSRAVEVVRVREAHGSPNCVLSRSVPGRREPLGSR